MAIQLRRDEQLLTPARVRDQSEDDALLRAGTRIAVRAALWIVVPGGLALALSVRALKPAIVAADKLLAAESGEWWNLWMPVLLLAFLGALVGAAITWRIMSAASIGRPSIWLVSIVAILAVLACGTITALLVFTPVPPIMCWVGLGLFTAAAFGCVHFVIHWLD